MTRRLFIEKPLSSPAAKERVDDGVGGFGKPLCPVESCRLRLGLPFVLPARLFLQLTSQALLGARLEAAVQGTGYPKANGETPEPSLRLCFFDVERLLTEALDFEPGKTLVSDGLLPIAGCGRRTAGVVLVSFACDDGAYALSYIDPEAPATALTENEKRGAIATRPLIHASGVRLNLENVLELARACPGAALRRRVLRKRRGRSLPNSADPSRPRAAKRLGAETTTSRTLDLFH